ncbi:MAG: KdsC family phosphatase [Sphingobacteriaceae bacterium]
MDSFLNKLHQITTFIFDVDGVLTDGSILVTEAGEQLRSFNIKDGYAMQLAIKCGYQICAISGGRSTGVGKRLKALGVRHVFLGVVDKTAILEHFIKEEKIQPQHILYMGDDVPDLAAMQSIGLPVCPADAAEEIKAISLYISPINGGNGCARDVIEKVLKVQGRWMTELVASM